FTSSKSTYHTLIIFFLLFLFAVTHWFLVWFLFLPSDNFNLVLDSSDDEAPEEVTFEDSRAQALRSMKQALETARREKELLKEKRRKRQELFQEQKVSVINCSCVSLKGNYTVTTVTKEPAASMQQRAAEDFIQSRLYGPGSCRSTSKAQFTRQRSWMKTTKYFIRCSFLLTEEMIKFWW
uniref:Nucleolar protein 7 n=1 Tax=Sphaeramia orbicularis TaxID=375764 RepID=A0A673AKU9_9TELE